VKLALLLNLALGLVFSSSLAFASTCQPATEQVQVSAVYPTADTLPENLLRFYIYFSQPMQREDILSSIFLTDADDNKLDGVFLDNKFDLWSPDNTRLTLLFDPGRVKTGLVAHNAMGRALIPGSEYQLIVDASAQSAKGCKLASRFVKTFKASEADYELPDVEQWKISRPLLGSRNALTVELNGVIDHVSLAYRVRVKDKAGETVAGNISLSKHEQQWVFVPAQPWKKDSYRLMVDPVLEDVAGNRTTGLFDQPSLAKESAEQKGWLGIDINLIEGEL